MNNIIDSASESDLNQIRGLVSIGFDVIDLTDDDIRQDVFLEDAELRIKTLIPNWETLTGDNLKRLRIATMKQTAINILIAFARINQESADGLSTSRQQLTPKEVIARYENDIGEGVEFLNPETDEISSRYITEAVIV